MSTVYLMSDLHVGHKSILKYRPEFGSTDEHNQTMIDNMLSAGGNRDTLWLLGDVCFDKEYAWMYEKACNTYQNVNLILGNHCSQNKELQGVIGFAIMCGVSMHSLVSKKGVWLSHAPIHPDELRGRMNVHGHTHRHTINDSRYKNVCVEHTNWKPIKFKDVLEELAENNQ